LYCRVKWLSTDVSEVRTASIIRMTALNIILAAAVRTWNLTQQGCLFRRGDYRNSVNNPRKCPGF
jgi:hypothetical protein